MTDPTGREDASDRADRQRSPLDETVTHGPAPADMSRSTEATHPEVYPRIEGYRIKRVIGRGGMGVVYEAVQEKLGRPVALKLLPAVVSSAHPELITRFRREAAAAAQLHHTNIIPIYDFGESRDGYYYAMELIDGRPLSALVKEFAAIGAPMVSHTAVAALLHDSEVAGAEAGSAVPADESPSTATGGSTGAKERSYYRQVARWTADAADALHYAHLRSMVHRDIKPSNLMLCRDGRVMILDFGLVKTVGEQSVTTTGSLVGSYRYMSPEQVGAKRISVDARSDVYSLGATLYELLTLQPAFATVEQSELLSQILFKEPTPPRKIVSAMPTDLQTICLKAMEKSPTQRYQTAREMADDLNRYLQDLAIVARPQGPLRRTAKFIRRRRWETTAVVSVVLVVVAVGAAMRYRSHREEAQRREEVARRFAVKQLKNTLNNQGQLAWGQSDWAAAREAYTSLLKIDAKDYAALVDLASVCSNQYDLDPDERLLDEAHDLLNQAIAVKPDGYEAWNVKGVVGRQAGRTKEAIEAYEKALDLNPDYYAVWVNLGMLHATDGNLEEAKRCLRKSTELPAAENDAMPWRVLAAVQLQSKDTDALASLDKARRIARTDIPTLALFAHYYLQQGDQQDVTTALEFATTANVLVQSQQTDSEDANQSIQDVIRVKRVLALARLRYGQWADAGKAARAALEVGDQPAWPRLILAVASARLGDLESAQAQLAEAEAAWPQELKRAEFHVIDDGRSLWFDSAEELELLRDEAAELIGGLAEKR